MKKQYVVTVISRNRLLENEVFNDEGKARDFYAGCLVKYPTCNVAFYPRTLLKNR